MISGVRVVNVPVQKPRTKEEYDIAQQMWPASFHFNQKTTADSNQELFELNENGNRWMNEVKEVARASGSPTSCIVVDPTRASVVARSCDLCDGVVDGVETTNFLLRQRLRTPVMRCIDIVARVHAQTSTRARAIAQRLSESTSCEVTDAHEDINRAPHHAQLAQQPTTEAYLLTGLDVYLTHEPSPMEAMALLHSRVARVFYEQADLHSGVLGSRGMLHEAKTINHRYKVYCICPALRDTGKRSSKVRSEEEEVVEMKGGRKKKKVKIIQ
jgi:tRNA-specific adenosine deaminase 3